jgi:cold shock CspA family protein
MTVTETQRETGTVAIYYADRKPFAFGFIRPDNFSGDDLFMSERALAKAGLAPLKRGDRVSFTVRFARDSRSQRQAWDLKLL